MVSFEFPLNIELVEMLFSRGLGPRERENAETGAVCTRVKSLPLAIASDLTDDKDEPSGEFSVPRKTTILFKSWMN